MLALVGQVQSAGLPGDDFRELLWLINAHPDLLGFDQIAENLHTLFQSETFKLGEISQPWVRKVSTWVTILGWIQDSRSVLAGHPELKGIYDHSVQNKGRHPVSRFGLTRHGLYACLWNRHETGSGQLSGTGECLAYQRLQAHLCIAHIAALSTYSTLSDFESYDLDGEFCGKPIQVYPASFVVRELSWSKYLPLLDRLPSEAGFQMYQQGISKLESDRTPLPGMDPGVGLDFVKKLSSYLSQVAQILETGKNPGGARKPSTHSGAGGGGRTHHGYVNISSHVYRVKAEEDDALSDRFGSVDLVYLRDGEDELDQEKGGEAPLESTIPILALYSTEEFGAAMGRAKYSERIKTLAAQRFPWSDNQLTSVEVDLLFRELESIWDRYVEMATPRVKDSEFCQGALLIGVMLNFGVPLEVARNLRWRKANTSPIAEFALLQADQHMSWRIPGVSPDYRTDLEAGYAKTNRQMVKSFVVPDLTGLGQKILVFRTMMGRYHERVFSFEPKTALANVLAVIKTLGDASRLTLGRITRVLENQVYAQTGDLTLAWCVCGNTGESNEPRMFYTAYPVQKLVNTYCEVIRDLRSSERSNPSPVPGGADGYVGARFVARKEVITALVSSLQTKLKTKVSLLQWNQVRQYHNAYTLYTWLVQAFSTAMRAINDPSDLLDQEETQTSLIYCLADKETAHHDRARPVFRSDLLKKQLTEYRQHRDYLINAFGYQRQTLQKETGLLRLFYLDIRDFPQPLTRGWIEQQLAEAGAILPGNFHRAYLRTELLESGCQPQVVDAFMGHANRGESPFDHYSSFEYRQFRESVAGHMGILLNEIGLMALTSRITS
ncbi:MAG: site-specific integrase [Betaproteobacteria bacterium]|nr:site-specific integrase [Betaproteobacteria bacterium]